MSASTGLKEAVQIVCTDVEPCLKKADYVVPAAAISAETENVLKEFLKNVEIPGFRRGKAPASMVRNRFSTKIDEEVVLRCVGAAFEKMVDNKDIEVLSYSMPSEKPKLESGADLCFSINFDVAPEIQLPNYKGLSISVAEEGVSDKEVDEKIAYFRSLYAEFKSLDEPAQPEDMLKISFSSDFAAPENASPALARQLASEESWLWMSSPEMIPGAIAAMTGSRKGEERSFAAEYPADYRIAELAGKKINYKVKVNEVQRKFPIESDSVLCERMKLGSMDELRKQIADRVALEQKARNASKLREQALSMIETQIPEFPFPPALLNSETQKELRNIANREVKAEKDVEKFKEEKEKHLSSAKESAHKKMRRFFILKRSPNLKISRWNRPRSTSRSRASAATMATGKTIFAA